jgi:uncharacterized Ntn-hydrolase superfamily protein
MNGKRILGSALIAAALAAGPAGAADLWFHVQVDGGRKGEQATINLPLSMVDKIASMISGEARSSGRVRIDDHDYSVAELRRIWQELERGPDATYVTVKEPDSKVRIAKRGDYLVVEANERGGEDVQARVPITVVRALLSGSGDELDVGAALEALARHGAGELVTVTGDDKTVRIWVDGVPEAR